MDKKDNLASNESKGLKQRNWKRFLRGPDASLLEELYVPALKISIHYDRCCSYFSSTVLAAASRGFAGLIENIVRYGERIPKPAVRLIVNEELTREDVKAIIETGNVKPLEEVLKKRFKEPKDILEKERLTMLAWLVKEGWLEVRVGVMRTGEGIVHAKFGIIEDEFGNAIVFSGSGNESASGLVANYENLEVSTSWDDPERYQHYKQEFELLWNDTHPDVHLVSLPEAVKLRLIKYAPPEPPIKEPSNIIMRQKAAMIWRFISELPYMENGDLVCDETCMIDLWPHQKQVVAEASAAWPDGRLLCDEVGMGKTIEAIAILRRLMAGRGVKRVLILLPAGIVKQWQSELREKGGIIAPVLEGLNYLVWPDRKTKKISGLAEALKQEILLMSRETARTENNLQIILSGENSWDLVILDESHAARRKRQVEGEFNSANLLLNLLRQLQYKRKARGFLLLSATPMQTHPWEPWDLMTVLGEGRAWGADFNDIRIYYNYIYDLEYGNYNHKLLNKVATLVNSANADLPPINGSKIDSNNLNQKLTECSISKKLETADWLREVSPLGRRMHRNTRETLKEYYINGLIPSPPPKRIVIDILFDYKDEQERKIYSSIKTYIDRRFSQLEQEKPGKGFVMTIYRRRATSSPYALKKSLERRLAGLKKIIDRRAYDADFDKDEMLSPQDLDDLGLFEDKISAAFPSDPEIAKKEASEVEQLLEHLNNLRGIDSKRDIFYEELKKITEDGRAVLIFTEYVDTMHYIRDNIVDLYGKSVGCYSGEGGELWDGEKWVAVPKDNITKKLEENELKIMICTDAASEGLNLQAAGALINYDLPWNPSRIEQRIGRIDRIGQKHREIKIINLFLKNSIDERVYGILRKRCGLFEQFVGEMQPVLSKARAILIGKEPVENVSDLETEAQRVKNDFLITETYRKRKIKIMTSNPSPFRRSDFVRALNYLNKDIGIYANRDKNKNYFIIKGNGLKPIKCTFEISALESDPLIEPLHPASWISELIASKLSKPGELWPLIFGSYQENSFRATIAYWIGNNELKEINNFYELENLVNNWTGEIPNKEIWLKALKAAENKAKELVKRMVEISNKKENKNRQNQLEAAKLRLLKELGRFLVCINNDIGDLNQIIFEQINKHSPTALRLKRCLEKLGGRYPEWPDSIIEELQEFLKNLTEEERSARLLGKQLDAALDDPRWAVNNN